VPNDFLSAVTPVAGMAQAVAQPSQFAQMAQAAMAPKASPYAKPGPYATKLSPQEERQFTQWVQQNKIPWKDSPTADYDMRGYWRAMLAGDPNAKQAANRHFPDTYKTPYHKTFSNESRYAMPDAPKWVESATDWKLVDKNGKVVAVEKK